MRDPVVVVGSGASAVHFALTLLDKGRPVEMIDVGFRPGLPPYPEHSFNDLKRDVGDPVSYFLGGGFESLVLPGAAGEYYGFPPGKEHVFRPAGTGEMRATGFAPLLSYAAGGLAEAWTGGCYPFNDGELRDFPYGYAEIAPYYAKVAARIGITGTEDDLAEIYPVHDHLLAPLDLDPHARVLLSAYERSRDALTRRYGFRMGQARISVLSREHRGRPACDYLGRCLWGCPRGSFYTPSITLDECRRREGFAYRPGLRVEHFRFGDGGRVAAVVARDIGSGGEVEIPVGTLAIGAGTLATARILLTSIRRETGGTPELTGLMDNRQILMPFVNRKLLGRRPALDSYQYHQLTAGLASEDPFDYVHGLITTLSTALIHPIVQSIPTSLGTATRVFRRLRAALGLLNINFSDRRRPRNRVTLEETGRKDRPRLVVTYGPPEGERDRLEDTTRRFRKILGKLSCVAPKGMTHVRPMGASVHYSGTVPMCAEGGEGTSDEFGKVRGFENLYVVDGSTFPALPAKNLTFTLMANATRIADQAFDGTTR